MAAHWHSPPLTRMPAFIPLRAGGCQALSGKFHYFFLNLPLIGIFGEFGINIRMLFNCNKYGYRTNSDVSFKSFRALKILKCESYKALKVTISEINHKNLNKSHHWGECSRIVTQV